ncbi:MAG: hypothetical protein EXQ98_03440 [Alphaproteobacteria bacterium]|nr:hypothetical protein [Alphaproteobacteria bacterium]
MTDLSLKVALENGGPDYLGVDPPNSQFLCWCTKTTRDDFQNAIWGAPDTQFYELCADVGVGTKCTSCLLDAEAIYDETSRHSAARGNKSSKSNRAEKRGVKRIVYDWLDRISPRVAVPLRGIVPILTGDGVSTIASVANSVSRSIGPRSPHFAVRFNIYDAGGRRIDSIAKTLAPGERLDHEITGPIGSAGLSTGSCRMSMIALSEGFRGSIRPHFTIKTTCSLSTVHSQGNGRRTSFVRTAVPPRGETQYLSVVNCEQEPASIQIQAVRGDEEIMRRQLSLAPYGAALVELELPKGADDTARPLIASLKSDRMVRTHAMVAAGDPARISLHHI